MLLLLAACDGTTPPAVDGPDTDSGHADTAPADTAADTDVPEVALPASCAAPDTLPADPLVRTGQVRLVQEDVGYLVELVDVDLDGERAYAVGQGGLVVYDVADPATPRRLGGFPEGGMARYHRVEPLGDGVHVAVTHRDHGLEILDVSDPEAVRPVASLGARGWEGLAARGDRLYVAGRDALVTLDISDPSRPETLSEVPGLVAPWELSAFVGDHLYAADNAQGVVPIDVSDPDEPVVGAPVPLDGSALHVRAADGVLYASAGGAGVYVLDAAHPAAPVVVGHVETGGSAVMAAAAEGVLYIADHEGVAAFDLADPRAPTPLGRDGTEQFALAVDAESEVAWVANWALMDGWRADRGVAAGELDVPSRTVAAPGEVVVTNRGAGPLALLGAVGEGVTVYADPAVVPPGGQSTLRIEGAGTTLCLASDDPDEPLIELALTGEAGAPPVGEPAPDFVLTDLDGRSHRLADQLGNPVLLVYFATW